ncbi:MAG: C_GCAxxG_C_C family protein [Bacteroidales bacterium]|nr:C_GCAxxG_C_C family protein [Bacteroidales bacterium]
MNLTNISINPEERRKMAMDYFLQGYNCSQSVLLTFSDVIEADPKMLKIITSGFGGGMGRLREVCGAFSSMVMMAGFISPADDPTIKESRTNNYALVQSFAEKFMLENGGSVVCRELLGLSKIPTTESPVPSDRTPEYYKKRPCPEIIGNAAKVVAEMIKGEIV